MRLPRPPSFPTGDSTDRLARLLTVLASAYLFLRVGMGLVSGATGDTALAAVW